MIKRGLAISNHLHNRTRNFTKDHTQVLSVPTEDPGIDMVGQGTLWWGRVGEIPRKNPLPAAIPLVISALATHALPSLLPLATPACISCVNPCRRKIIHIVLLMLYRAETSKLTIRATGSWY